MRRKTVALSTCEAKYVAASEAAKEGLWIQGLLHELKLIPISTIPIEIDNEAALRRTCSLEHRERSKHIDVRHDIILESVQSGKLITNGVKGPDNKADIFTKAPSRMKLVKMLIQASNILFVMGFLVL
jgi:hypothetical protein